MASVNLSVSLKPSHNVSNNSGDAARIQQCDQLVSLDASGNESIDGLIAMQEYNVEISLDDIQGRLDSEDWAKYESTDGFLNNVASSEELQYFFTS